MYDAEESTMLSHAEVFRRSLKYASVLVAADVGVALLPLFKWVEASSAGVLGDLLLVEVAIAFIVAGILDISSSAGMTGFKRLFSSDVEYSSIKREEAERHAMVFVVTGLFLLAAMIVLAILDLWTLNV
jgi:hypothetical protein